MAPRDIEALRAKIAQAQAAGFRTPRNNVLDNLTNSIESVKKTVKKGQGLKLDDVRKMCAEKVKVLSESFDSLKASLNTNSFGEIVARANTACLAIPRFASFSLLSLEAWKAGSSKVVAAVVAIVFMLVCTVLFLSPHQIAPSSASISSGANNLLVPAQSAGEIDPTTGELVPFASG
eukprot:1196396-Prorocentrum_minimum.AAC.15